MKEEMNENNTFRMQDNFLNQNKITIEGLRIGIFLIVLMISIFMSVDLTKIIPAKTTTILSLFAIILFIAAIFTLIFSFMNLRENSQKTLAIIGIIVSILTLFALTYAVVRVYYAENFYLKNQIGYSETVMCKRDCSKTEKGAKEMIQYSAGEEKFYCSCYSKNGTLLYSHPIENLEIDIPSEKEIALEYEKYSDLDECLSNPEKDNDTCYFIQEDKLVKRYTGENFTEEIKNQALSWCDKINNIERRGLCYTDIAYKSKSIFGLEESINVCDRYNQTINFNESSNIFWHCYEIIGYVEDYNLKLIKISQNNIPKQNTNYLWKTFVPKNPDSANCLEFCNASVECTINPPDYPYLLNITSESKYCRMTLTTFGYYGGFLFDDCYGGRVSEEDFDYFYCCCHNEE